METKLSPTTGIRRGASLPNWSDMIDRINFADDTSVVGLTEAGNRFRLNGPATLSPDPLQEGAMTITRRGQWHIATITAGVWGVVPQGAPGLEIPTAALQPLRPVGHPVTSAVDLTPGNRIALPVKSGRAAIVFESGKTATIATVKLVINKNRRGTLYPTSYN